MLKDVVVVVPKTRETPFIRCNIKAILISPFELQYFLIDTFCTCHHHSTDSDEVLDQFLNDIFKKGNVYMVLTMGETMTIYENLKPLRT